MFKDHVRVIGVKKGTVSMKAFTVPLQKAPKLNLKVRDSHNAFLFEILNSFEFRSWSAPERRRPRGKRCQSLVFSMA